MNGQGHVQIERVVLERFSGQIFAVEEGPLQAKNTLQVERLQPEIVTVQILRCLTRSQYRSSNTSVGGRSGRCGELNSHTVKSVQAGQLTLCSQSDSIVGSRQQAIGHSGCKNPRRLPLMSADHLSGNVTLRLNE